MKVIEKENIRPFDVDHCLVKEVDGVLTTSTLLQTDIVDPLTGLYIKVRVNQAMVRLLKEEHHRGGYIIVWSRSGYEWARNVITALRLEQYVHLVMSKPVVYFDDTPIENWLKDRVFLDFDFVYKVTNKQGEK